MNINFLIGILAGTYLNNNQFRSQVDKGIKDIISKGIDILNQNHGGDANVSSVGTQEGRYPIVDQPDSQHRNPVPDNKDS